MAANVLCKGRRSFPHQLITVPNHAVFRMTLLYQQTNVSIYHNQSEHWLYADWTGYQAVEQVKQGCEQLLLCMLARQTYDILNDNTNVAGIWTGAAEWVGTNWFPRLRAKGMRRFAWVYSPSRFSQISTDSALQVAPPDIAKVFSTMAEAEEWLRERRDTADRAKRFTQRLR
jgi:hypothetical protein